MTDGEQDSAVALRAQEARIACVLNLHDTQQTLSGINAPWYVRLVQAERVVAMEMSFDYCGGDFCQKLARGLRFMIAHHGPYLIHCHAGVDRTGFVSAVLEALMGASVLEIETDYLRSFEEEIIAYFRESGFHPTSFEQLTRMNSGTPVTDETARQAAETFLMGAVGLSPAEVAALRERLM
jgi:hypothetical protein